MIGEEVGVELGRYVGWQEGRPKVFICSVTCTRYAGGLEKGNHHRYERNNFLVISYVQKYHLHGEKSKRDSGRWLREGTATIRRATVTTIALARN